MKHFLLSAIFILCCNFSFAQEVKICGTVWDTTVRYKGLPDAEIYVEGQSSNHCKSGSGGKFSNFVVDGMPGTTKILIVNLNGYVPQRKEIKLVKDFSYDIYMLPADNNKHTNPVTPPHSNNIQLPPPSKDKISNPSQNNNSKSTSAEKNTPDELLMHELSRRHWILRLGLIKKCIGDGANPLTIGHRGWTALHEAALQNDTAYARKLVEEWHVPINVTNKNHSSPLNIAASAHSWGVYYFLLKQPTVIDTFHSKKSWKTPRQFIHNPEVLRISDSITKQRQDTDHVDTVALVNKEQFKAFLNIESWYSGQSILPGLNLDSISDRLKYFIGHGADIKTVGKDGTSVLHLACLAHNADIINQALISGVDINLQTLNKHITPLMCAASGNDVPVMRNLLYNRDINIKLLDIDKFDALDYAYGNTKSYSQIVDFIKRNKYSYDIKPYDRPSDNTKYCLRFHNTIRSRYDKGNNVANMPVIMRAIILNNVDTFISACTDDPQSINRLFSIHLDDDNTMLIDPLIIASVFECDSIIKFIHKKNTQPLFKVFNWYTAYNLASDAFKNKLDSLGIKSGY